MDPERINHNLAGSQMGQNYDGILVKVLNVRR